MACKVGVKTAGGVRALSKQNCNDQASANPTILLFEDAAFSDLNRYPEQVPVTDESPRVVVALCVYHADLYRGQRYCDKCGNTTCYNEAVRAFQGVPVCLRNCGPSAFTEVPLGLSLVGPQAALQAEAAGGGPGS